MRHINLPAEIWFHIFRIATTCPASRILFEIDYAPFNDLSDEAELKKLEDVRFMKATLVLVCRQWRALAAKYFYEDIRVCHGLQGLYDSLKRSIDVGGEGYGAFVRRIELSMKELDNLDPGIFTRITLEDILKLCPHIEIISKTADDLIPHVINSPSIFRQLKRFDWRSSYRKGMHGFAIDNDDPTHGVRFLYDVVSRAANLRCLSIGGRSYEPSVYDLCLLSTRIPALTTLRIESLQLLERVQRWELASLAHIITNVSLRQPCLINLGARAKVLELIYSGGVMENHHPDHVSNFLAECSNVIELNFEAEYMYPLTRWDLSEYPTINSSVRCIRLSASLDRMSRWYYASGWADRRSTDSPPPSFVQKHYEDHFAFFSTAFSALERIVLYGDWGQIMESNRFQLLAAQFISRGCALQYNHGNGVVDAISSC